MKKIAKKKALPGVKKKRLVLAPKKAKKPTKG